MFKNLFKNKTNTVAKTKKKLALVVGHNSRRKGAKSVKGEYEYDFWNGIAKEMKTLAKEYDLDVKVFNRIDCGSYSKEIENVYKLVDNWIGQIPSAGVVCELHFNSNASDKPNGCEMLCSGSSKGIALANALQMECVRVFGFKNRGVKTLSKGDRGYKSVVASKFPTIITETHFGSSPDDWQKVHDDDSRTLLSKTLLNGVKKGIGTDG